MPRAHIWPEATPPDNRPEAASGTVSDAAFADFETLAATLGPELTRLFGLRTSVRQRPPGAAGAPLPLLLLAGKVSLVSRNASPPNTGQQQTAELLVAAPDIDRLLNLLFGGRPDPAAAAAVRLPPNSGSWAVLAQFLGQAVSRALGASGTPARVADAPPAAMAIAQAQVPQLLLDLDFEGVGCLLGLRVPLPCVPAPPPDPALWRRRTRERALDLLLPVTLRVARLPLPLGDVSALQPGDILPLEHPRDVDLMVGGQSFARIAADRLASSTTGPEEQP